ncbi:PhzF family phenazine biosynthesis protein [Mangrovitalea sediminis]|uniref:PhzF family phenazine biosynthesis protein n=1 Tax=Mangrovitalea sediminis TaxID=1982043 RepID=UPI000BE5B3CB|nr:PhzF family phenazine biosynthesis protein [Mangrovitalea sediminis]
MTTLTMYQVDAFTHRLFGGNPAAVVPLERWINDSLLQAIAKENNLSETAFFVETGAHYQLRWFTPATEVPLCGHATLASAWVIFNELDPELNEIQFSSLSGPLSVRRLDRGWMELDFPAFATEALEAQDAAALSEAMGARPGESLRVLDKENAMLVFERAEQVRGLAPDLRSLRSLPYAGVIATAPGDDCDFVSRYFAPAVGIDEDPVTGSIHCGLTPYWADRLGKTTLEARQISSRGGVLRCSLRGDRVGIAGQAVPYLTGELTLGED